MSEHSSRSGGKARARHRVSLRHRLRHREAVRRVRRVGPDAGFQPGCRICCVREARASDHLPDRRCQRVLDLRAAIERARAEWGGTDVLVNNAGVDYVAPLVEHDEDEFDRLIAINLRGVFLGMNDGTTAIAESGGGAIVNIASIAGMHASAVGRAAYAASKAGVIALTKTQGAIELGEVGVRANAVCPGMIKSPTLRMHRDFAWRRPAEFDWRTGSTRSRDGWGTPPTHHDRGRVPRFGRCRSRDRGCRARRWRCHLRDSLTVRPGGIIRPSLKESYEQLARRDRSTLKSGEDGYASTHAICTYIRDAVHDAN